MRSAPALLCSFVAAVALLAAACGGGGDDGGEAPGQRVTDPAKVPSSTPIQSPVLYTIRGDTISTSGGSTTISGTTTPSAGGARTYVVKSGDSCSSIAAALGVTVDALIRANRSINESCSNLRIDDQLRVPAASPAAGTTPAPGATPRPGASGGKTYTVRAGDTCGAIAANQGVDVAKLISLNGLDAGCQGLQVGQVLTIP